MKRIKGWNTLYEETYRIKWRKNKKKLIKKRKNIDKHKLDQKTRTIEKKIKIIGMKTNKLQWKPGTNIIKLKWTRKQKGEIIKTMKTKLRMK